MDTGSRSYRKSRAYYRITKYLQQMQKDETMAKLINELPTPQELASDLTIDREYIIREDIRIPQEKRFLGYKDLYPGQRNHALNTLFEKEIQALEECGIKYRINSSSSRKTEGKGKTTAYVDVVTRGIAFFLPAANAESFLHALCRIHNEEEIEKMISNGLTQQMFEALKGTDSVKEITERIFQYFETAIQKDKDNDDVVISGPYKFSCSKSGVNLEKNTFVSYKEMGCDNLEDNQLWAYNAITLENLIDRIRKEPYIVDVLINVTLNGRPKHEFQVLYAGRE